MVTINPHQVIRLFKPNILFKSFEMKDSVDRVLVYVTLYIVGEKKGIYLSWGRLDLGKHSFKKIRNFMKKFPKRGPPPPPVLLL